MVGIILENKSWVNSYKTSSAQHTKRTMRRPRTCCQPSKVRCYLVHRLALKAIYFHLRHRYGINECNIPPYKHSEVKSVVFNRSCIIFWNFAFSTTQNLWANKLDIVALDHNEKILYIVETLRPSEANIIAKKGEKWI